MDRISNRKQVSRRLQDEYEQLGTWAKVAALYGLGQTTVFRVASPSDGYEPRDAKVRATLGLLPYEKTKIMVCQECHSRIEYMVYKDPCPYCGDFFVFQASHLDHIIPRANGGPDNPENLVRCCEPCNLWKSGRDPWEWFGDDWKPPEIYAEQFAAIKETLYPTQG